jgi:hypothetical protein
MGDLQVPVLTLLAEAAPFAKPINSPQLSVGKHRLRVPVGIGGSSQANG